jgi:hypothetical protein
MICSRKLGESESPYCYYPFVSPGGDPDDLFPTLYKTKTETFRGSISNGIQKALWKYDSGPLEQTTEQYTVSTLVNYLSPANPGTGIYTQTNYVHTNLPTPSCNSNSTSGQSRFFTFLPNPVIVPCPDALIAATTLTFWIECREFREGTDLTPQGCPGPFTPAAQVRYINFDQETKRSYELSDSLSSSDLTAQAIADMNANEWSDPFQSTYSDGLCSPYFSLSWPKISQYTYPLDPSQLVEYFPPQVYAAAVKVRFRFRIPTSHIGTYFKITYDVAEFPQDEDVDPSFVSQDNVVEWTGPGNQEDPDGDSWLTPWEEIDPPEVSGERHVVNIRYTCYTGTKYGAKPQVIGAAFEPPTP